MQAGERCPRSQVTQGLGAHLGRPDQLAASCSWPSSGPLVCDIVGLASATADAEWRRRSTAVVLCFLVCRRSTEVLELQLQDVSLLSDGAFHLQVQRFKNAKGRSDPHRLVYTVPVDPDLTTDPVLALLSRMILELAEGRAPPNRHIFSTPSLPTAPTPNHLTHWLQHIMSMLQTAPPPGVRYTSYSARAGGATALYVVGVPLVAVAAMLGHKDNDTRTAISSYIDVLAPWSSAALRLCGRWLRTPVGVRRPRHSPSAGSPESEGKE